MVVNIMIIKIMTIILIIIIKSHLSWLSVGFILVLFILFVLIIQEDKAFYFTSGPLLQSIEMFVEHYCCYYDGLPHLLTHAIDKGKNVISDRSRWHVLFDWDEVTKTDTTSSDVTAIWIHMMLIQCWVCLYFTQFVFSLRLWWNSRVWMAGI